VTSTMLLDVSGLRVAFPVRQGGHEHAFYAVDGVDLRVAPGEIVGLVGESGSGKSTIARAVVGLCAVESGAIAYGTPASSTPRVHRAGGAVQMVFQDPYSSLNPRMTIRQQLSEVLRVHRVVPKESILERCEFLMRQVGLPPQLLHARPSQMSGGQRQRVAIARALAFEPRLLVADEPVSALDVSVQAEIVNLFADLRDRLGLSIVFIAHDLSVVSGLCDRVAVIYMGRIVEQAPTADLFGHPRHPYTRGLLAAVPRMGRARAEYPSIVGEMPSALHTPSGCRFRTRCPHVQELCSDIDPALKPANAPLDVHVTACLFPIDTVEVAGPRQKLGGTAPQ